MSTASNILRSAMEMSTFVANSYLEDLTDEDLLRRPAPNANHIAWQLGHLVSSEHNLTDAVCPGSMPDLPAGFAEKHTKETSGQDDPAQFCGKDEYLRLAQEQRAGTLAALEGLTDEDLEKPAPEAFRDYAPTVGAIFALQASHWMMHSGQWVVVRRQLGREAMF